jgi:hypothetical protein
VASVVIDALRLVQEHFLLPADAVQLITDAVQSNVLTGSIGRSV